jgi:hypothetical protein
LADETLVQNRIKSVGCVAGEEVTAGVFAVTVEEQTVAAIEKTREFGDDLYKSIESVSMTRVGNMQERISLSGN